MRTQAVWAGRIFQGIWPPIIFGVGFLALWEWFVEVRDIKPFVLPKPSAIFEQLRLHHDTILEAARITGANALVGLAVGLVVGVIAALLAARLRVLDEMLDAAGRRHGGDPDRGPDADLQHDVRLDLEHAAAAGGGDHVFFPIFVNTLRGLRQIDPVHAELMRSYAASPWTTTKVVRLPGALPFFFTGLKIASSGAVIAAIVSEYFGGLQKGLGPAITSAAAASAYPRAWAIVTAAIGARPRLLPRRGARRAPGDALATTTRRTLVSRFLHRAAWAAALASCVLAMARLRRRRRRLVVEHARPPRRAAPSS